MPDKALFIGHSLVGPVMPAMFNTFMYAQGLAMRADAQVINGAPLRWNWDNGATAEGVNARDVLPGGDYSAVIVTEAIPLDDHIRWNDSEGYAKRYFDLAISANPDTQFYVYETWHEIGADTTAWRAQIAADLHKWEGIADHINAAAPEGAPDALIVPAGQALAYLHDAIEAGQVAGLSSIHDLFSDNIHLNETGVWFMSAVHARVVGGADTATLPLETFSPWGSPYEAPSAALAGAMAQVIEQTVSAYARDGVEVGGVVPDPQPQPDPEPDTDGNTGEDLPALPPSDNTPENQPPASDDTAGLGLGFGLSHIADYAPASPFLDVFKTSRPFFGHEVGQWGGVNNDDLAAQGLLDANGWPVEIPAGLDKIGTLILTEFPAEMTDAAGRYRVTWEGSGDIEIGLAARDVTYGQNEAWFTFVPDGTALVSVDILSTDPSNTGDNIRAISVVHERHVDAFDAGAVFNPKWIDIIEDAHSLRFMDWMDTNNSRISTPQDAPHIDDATWAKEGVPLEVMIQLANETQTDPWFTLPHLATEAYMRAFVTQVREGLDEGLVPYFEFSNEVWNWQFEQAQHANADGQARFPGVSSAWVQDYAADAVAMAEIIDEVYGTNSPNAIKVLATQTGWRGLEEAILNAPDWVAQDAANRAAPSTYFDAYAITGYFDGGLGRDGKAQTVLGWIADSLSRAEVDADAAGLSGAARDAYVQTHRYEHATELAIREIRDGSVTGDPDGSLAELAGLFVYHKVRADAAGLELVMYEGGTHVVGVGQWQSNSTLTDFLGHLNYSAGMGAIYEELFQAWADAGGGLFNAFTAVDRPSQFGSWGHLRHLDDVNPRMDAVEDFLAAYPKAATPDEEVSPPDVVPPRVPDPDPMIGDDLDNRLTGGDGADDLRGFAGNDILQGRGGDDNLNGGAGWDRAVFSGAQENYTLTIRASGIEITDRRLDGDGTDQLADIEELQFAGQETPFDLEQFSGAQNLTPNEMAQFIELYIAYFNRAPDAIGLNFWGTAFANGMSLQEIAALFIDQDETRATYPDSMSTNDLATAVYGNVLGRAPDQDGFDFWTTQLESGTVGRDQFILAVLEGAKATPQGQMPEEFIAQQIADRQYLADKTDIGAYFSVHLGMSDLSQAESVMALYDSSAAGFETAMNRIESLHKDVILAETDGFLMPLLGVIDPPADW